MINILQSPSIAATTNFAATKYCINDVSNPFIVSSNSGGISYQWYSTITGNINTDSIRIIGATDSIFSPPTNTTNKLYYYVRLKNNAIGSCQFSNSNATGLIQVDTLPYFITQPLNAQSRYCVGNIASNLTVQASNNTIAYQWYKNINNNNNTGFIISSGANAASYRPLTDSVNTRYYYVVIDNGGKNSCRYATSNQSGDIIVDSFPTKPIINGGNTQTVCAGAANINLEIANIQNGVSYQWFRNIANAQPGNAIINATNNSFTISTQNTSAFYYYVQVTKNNCTLNSDNTALITVNTAPTITWSGTSSNNQNYCLNSTANPLTINTTGNIISYAWYKSNTSNRESSIINSNKLSETLSSLVPATSSVGDSSFYFVVISSGANCEVTSTSSGNIKVLQNPSITVSTNNNINKNYCNNSLINSTDSIEATIATGQGNITNIIWYQTRTSNNIGGVQVASGINQLKYLPKTDSVGRFNYYAKVVDANTCFNISNISNNIIINPLPSFAQQPLITDVNYCSNNSIGTLSVIMSDNNTYTYRWIDSSILNNTITDATGINNSINYTPSYNLNNFITKQSKYFVIATNATTACISTSNASGLVTIVAQPQITGITNNVVYYCKNAVLQTADSIGITSVGGLNLNQFSWYKNVQQNTNAGVLISTNTKLTKVLPITNNADTGYYYLVVGNNAGCTNTSGVSGRVLIRNLPLITSNPINSGDIKYCKGKNALGLNAAATALEPNSSITGYSWFSNVNPTNTGGKNLNNSSATLIPKTDSVSILYYYFIVSDNNNCMAISSVSSRVIVNELPTITANIIQKDTNYCLGSTPQNIQFTISSAAGGLSYKWYAVNSVDTTNTDSLVIGQNSSNLIPITNISSTKYYFAIGNDNNSCSATSRISGRIQIFPTPTISRLDTINRLYTVGFTENVFPLTVTATNDVATNGFTWYYTTNNDFVTGLTKISSDNANNTNSYTPNTNILGSKYYFVIATNNNGCNVRSNLSGEINITNPPIITILNTAKFNAGNAICINQGNDTLFVTGTTGSGTSKTFQWYKNKSKTTNNAILIAGATDSFYIIPNNVVDTNYYFVILKNNLNIITTSPVSGVFKTNGKPSIQLVGKFSSDTNYCKGANAANLQINATKFDNLNSLTYTWYVTPSGNYADGTIITNGVSFNRLLPSTLNLINNYYYVKVTESNTGCEQISSISGIQSINDRPTIGNLKSIQTNQTTYCLKGTTQNLFLTGITAGTNATINNIQWFNNANQIIDGATLLQTGTSTQFSPSSILAGTLYYFAIITNNLGCTDTSAFSAIKVFNKLNINNSTTNTNRTYCQSNVLNSTNVSVSVNSLDNINTFQYQWYSKIAGSNLTSLINGATINNYSPAINNVGIFSYFVVVTYSALNCKDTSEIIATDTIKSLPTISNLSTIPLYYCKNSSTANITVSATANLQNANLSYEWFRSNDINNLGNSLGVTGLNYIRPDSSLVGTYYYKVAVSNGLCTNISSQSGGITINKLPIIRTATNAVQHVCINGQTANISIAAFDADSGNNISYKWFSNANNNNETGTLINNEVNNAITPINNVSGAMYYYVVLNNNLVNNLCQITSQVIGQVNVYSQPTITTNNFIAQKYCLNSNTAAMSITANNNGVGILRTVWYKVDSLNNLLDSVSNANTFNATTVNTGKLYYFAKSININAPNANCNNTNTGLIPVEVFTLPIVNNISNAVFNYCQNQSNNITSLNVSATNGGYGKLKYQWYSNTTNSNQNGNLIIDSTNNRITPQTTNSGTSYYYVVVSNGGLETCGSTASNVSGGVNIIQNPTLVVRNLNSQFYCQADIANGLKVVGQSNNLNANPTYQWYSSADGLTNWTQLQNQTDSIFVPATNNVGTTYYRVEVGNGNCFVTSPSSGAIVINSKPIISNQQLYPSGNSICINSGSITLQITGADPSGNQQNVNYQWYDSSVGNTWNRILTNGTAASYIIPNNVAITKYYYVEVTNKVGNNCKASSSISGGISILDNININNALFTSNNIAKKYCLNSNIQTNLTISASITNGLANNLSYIWYKNNDVLNYNGDSVGVGVSFKPPTNIVGRAYYYVIVTNDLAPLGSNCRTANSTFSNSIEVFGKPIITNLTTTKSTYCLNDNSVSTIIATGTNGGYGTLSYKWYQNFSNDTINGNLVSTTSVNNFTPNIQTVGNKYYYVVLSNGGIVGCDTVISKISNIININVNDIPTIFTQPTASPLMYCINDVINPLTVSAISNNANNPTYQWFVTNNIAINGSPLVNGNNSSYSISNLAAFDSNFYRVVVSNGLCNVTSNYSGKVTINGLPKIISANLATQNYCKNQPILTDLNVTITDSKDGNNVIVNWFKNRNPNTINSINLNNNNTNFTPLVDSVGTYYYIANIRNNIIGNICATNLISGAIKVYDQPTITTINLSGQKYCVGSISIDSLKISASNGGLGSISTQWFSNTTGNINVGTQTSIVGNNNFLIPSINTVGRKYYYALVTNTDAPAGTCRAAYSSISGAIEAYITPNVNSSPSILSNLNVNSKTYCIGTSVLDTLTINGDNGGYGTLSYQWYRNTTNTSTGGIAVGSNSTSPYYTPTFNVNGTFYYYVKLSNGGIPGCDTVVSNATFAVNVESGSTITAQPFIKDSAICQNVNNVVIQVQVDNNVPNNNLQFQWYKSKTNSKVNATQIGGVTSNNFITIPTNVIDTNYYYAQINNNAIATLACRTLESNLSGKITIKPIPILNQLPSNINYCKSTIKTPVSATPIVLDVLPGANANILKYEWYINSNPNNVNGTLVNNATGNSIVPAINTVNTQYFYAVVTNTNNCNLNTNIIATVNTLSKPVFTIQPFINRLNAYYCRTNNGLSDDINVTAINVAVGEQSLVSNQINYYWYKKTSSLNFSFADSVEKIIGVSGLNRSYQVNIAKPDSAFYFVVAENYNGCREVSDFVVNTNSTISKFEIAANPTITNETLKSNTRKYCVDISGINNSSSLSINRNGYNLNQYSWIKSLSSNRLNGTIVANNSDLYAPLINTIGINYYYLRYQYGSANCTDSTTILAIDTVYSNISITETNFAAQQNCLNGALPNPYQVNASSNFGNLSYEWFTNNLNNRINAQTTNIRTNTFTPSISNTGRSFYFVLVKNTDAPIGNCQTGFSNITGMFEVFKSPTLNSIAGQPKQFCKNTIIPDSNNLIAVADIGNYGTKSYQWYRNTLPNNTSGTRIMNATDSFYKPSTFDTGEFYYYVVVKNGATLSSCDSVISTVSGKFTILVTPIINLENLPNNTYCLNTTQPIDTLSITANENNSTYSWYKSNNPNLLGTLITGTNNSNKLLPDIQNVGTFYYKAVVSKGVCATISTTTSTIIINGLPSISANGQPSSIGTQIICQNDTSLTPTLNVIAKDNLNGNNLNYRWFISQDNNNFINLTEVGSNKSSIKTTAVTPGTFYYLVVISNNNNANNNNCAITSNYSGAININANPVIQAAGGQLSNLVQYYCINQNITPLQIGATSSVGIAGYQWYYSKSNLNKLNLVRINQIQPDNNYTPPKDSIGTKYYAVVITDINNCATTSEFSGAITINDIPKFSTNLNSAISYRYCVGNNSDILSVVANVNIGNPLYQWYRDTLNNNTFDGRPILNATTNQFSINTQKSDTAYYYVVVRDGNNCTNISNISGKVEVLNNPLFIVNPSKKDTSFCLNQSSNYTLQITKPSINFPIQWYKTTIQNSTNTGFLIDGATFDNYIPQTDSAGTYYYYAIFNDNNGCKAVSTASGGINVKQNAIINNVVNNITTNVCLNNIASPITLLANAPVGNNISRVQWIRANSSDMIDTLLGATSFTYTPINNLVGLYNYYVLVYLDNGCSSKSASLAKINVNQNPVLNNLKTGQAGGIFCQGDLININISIDNPNLYSLQWYKVKDTSYINPVPIANAINVNYIPLTPDTGNNYYFVTASKNYNGFLCSVNSEFSGNIRINPVPIISNFNNPSSNYCLNSTIPINLSINANSGYRSDTTLTYRWYSNNTSVTTGGEKIFEGLGIKSIQIPTSNISSLYYYVEVQNNFNCVKKTELTSGLISIVDNPFISNDIITQDTAYCLNAVTKTLTVNANIADASYGNLVRQWYFNTTNSYEGATIATNGTFGNYTPKSDSIGSKYYFVVFTQDKGKCKVSSSISGKISVLDNPKITTNLNLNNNPQTIYCIGSGNVTPLFVASADLNLTYKWYYSTSQNYNNDTVSINNPTNANSITPNVSISNNRYYFAKLVNNIGCYTLSNFSEQIIVYSKPKINISNGFLSGDVYCANSNSSKLLSVNVSDISGGLIQYQWYRVAINDTNNFTKLIGDTNSNYLPKQSAAGNYYFKVIASNNGPLLCRFDTSIRSGQYIVNAIPSITNNLPATAANLCLNQQSPISINLNINQGSGNGTVLIQWFQTSNNNINGQSLGNLYQTNSFAAPTNQTGTYQYYAQISNSNECTITTPLTGNFVVNTAPTIITDLYSTNLTYCKSATNVKPLIVTFNDANLNSVTYSWYKINQNGVAIQIPNTNSNTYKPNNLDTLHKYFVIATNINGCRDTSTQSGYYTFLQDGFIPTQMIPAIQTCLGTNFNVNFTVSNLIGGVINPTYEWYKNKTNSNIGGIKVANGQSYTPTADSAGRFYYYALIKFDTASGCSSVKDNIRETFVSNIPVIKSTTPSKLDVTYCVGVTPKPLNATASIAYSPDNLPLIYKWYSSTTNIKSNLNENTTASLTIGAENDSLFSPNNKVTSNSFYFATVSSGNCTVTSDVSGAITFNPIPTITQQLRTKDTSYPQGAISSILSINVLNNNISPFSFKWLRTTDTTKLGDSVFFLSSGTNSVYYPNTSNVGGFYFSVLVTSRSNNCTATSNYSGKISILTNTSITTQPANTDTSYCQNSTNIKALSVVANPGQSTIVGYQWYYNTIPVNSGGIKAGGNDTSITFTPPSTTVGYRYYYVVIKNSLNAFINSNVSGKISITARASISSTGLSDTAYCLNNVVKPLSLNIIGGNGVPTISWFTNNIDTILGAIPINNEVLNNLTPSNSIPGKTYYFAKLFYPNEVPACQVVYSKSVKVEVFGNVQINNVLENNIYCQNQNALNLTINAYNGGYGNLQYQWYKLEQINNNSLLTVISNANSQVLKTRYKNSRNYHILCTYQKWGL